jgi:hypothetical protein
MSADSVLLPAHLAGSGGPADPLADHSGVRPVDVFEVAAALEAAGVSDRVARQRYGHDDVFALARHRFDGWSRRPTAAAPAIKPEPLDVRGTLQRGLVFVLPALLTGAVLGRHPALSLVLAILVAVAVGWAAGQGIAYVGYRMLGAGSVPGARWQMMALAGLTVLASAAVGTAAGLLGVVGWMAIILAVGQIAFVLSTSIALVLDSPAVIGLTLLPGLCASVPALVQPDLIPRWLVLAAVGSTLVGTLGWVGYLLRDAHRPVSRLARAATRGALPYIGYGACLALLLSFALIDSIVAPTHVAIAITMAPLMCGVVVAEFQLARYRRRAELILRTNGTRAGAAGALRRAVLGCLSGYIVGLGLLTAVVILLLVPRPDAVSVLRFAGAGALGWAFLAALSLVAYQQLRPVLVATTAALVALAVRGLVPPAFGADRPTELATEYLVVVTTLAVVLTVVALRLLVKPELHR